MTKNKYIVAAFLIGFLYRMLLSLQGIDHTDLGFSNTFYQDIFSHPEAIPFDFNYYLTGLLGGIWYWLFGGTGVLGFRFLEAMMLTASIFFVYKTFERQLPRVRSTIVAILLSFLFPSIITTFHYNTVTFFFLSLAAWCYSKSLYGRQLLWIYLSGVAIGLCFFARIVNVALSVLVLVPVVYALATHRRALAMRLGGVMMGGMLTTCILMQALMAAIGHLPYFVKGLAEGIAYVGSVDILHASGNLLSIYVSGFINIVLQILAIIGLGALYIQCSRLTSKAELVLRIFLVIASLVLIATSLPYLSAIALYTLLCAPIFYSITPKEDKLIAAFVLVGTYVFPFGSDIGIAGIFHWTGALLIIPAATGLRHTSHILRRGVFICSIYIAMVMVWKALYQPYGELSPRWTCTERVGGSLLNAYTTPEKAADYRHVIAAIRQVAPDNPWLVLGNQASELFYATGKLPYLGNIQQNTITNSSLIHRLDDKYRQSHQLPVVVFLKKEHFMLEDTQEIQAQLRQWMSRHHYQEVVDDDHLTIYRQSPLASVKESTYTRQ